MSDIFISHIHEDSIAASALRRYLEAAFTSHGLPRIGEKQLRVFVSSDELHLGDDWLDKIRESLKSSRVVIALFSPEALSRPWVHFEAGGAWFSEGKTVIPLCIGGLHPAKLDKPYSNIQGADLHERWAPYDLLRSVHDLLDELKQRLPPPPPEESDKDLAELRSELERWGWARTHKS